MFAFAATDLPGDRALVARMATGDTDALRELHGRHAGRLFHLASRILPDREEAREAVQDAFVKAWRRAASYQADRGEVVAWLIFMARSTALDRLRETRRRQEILTQIVQDPLASPASPGPGSAPREDREILDQHLAELSAAQRQALELAFFSGYTQAEIAARMAAPVSTIKNHLHRGLLRLRQLQHCHE